MYLDLKFKRTLVVSTVRAYIERAPACIYCPYVHVYLLNCRTSLPARGMQCKELCVTVVALGLRVMWTTRTIWKYMKAGKIWYQRFHVAKVKSTSSASIMLYVVCLKNCTILLLYFRKRSLSDNKKGSTAVAKKPKVESPPEKKPRKPSNSKVRPNLIASSSFHKLSSFFAIF